MAILALNSHQYLEVYVAVPASGRVVVPLNTRHAEPELRYALEDSGTRVLITDRDRAPWPRTVEHVIMLPDEYETLLATAPEAELGVGITEDTLAGLFYTGGTTGASKGVMLSHRNLIANTATGSLRCSRVLRMPISSWHPCSTPLAQLLCWLRYGLVAVR